MSLMNRLFGSQFKQTKSEIQRSLEGIELETRIENFENTLDWEELEGPLKVMLKSVI